MILGRVDLPTVGFDLLVITRDRTAIRAAFAMSMSKPAEVPFDLPMSGVDPAVVRSNLRLWQVEPARSRVEPPCKQVERA